MTYTILGQSLFETADLAKAHFAHKYGARKFLCERPLEGDLPLRPTWQADLNGAYKLCVEVRESPFSPTLYEFVTECANRGMPVKLWVAVPKSDARPSFNSELRQAHQLGVGVIELAEGQSAHEFHKPVALSLFGLKKTDLNAVPRERREFVKAAEDSFLGGAPDQGCQLLCQELENVTRLFAEHTHNHGLWKAPQGAQTYPQSFFGKKAWALVLEVLDGRVDDKLVRSKCPAFSRGLIAAARASTDWRNSVSHKPSTMRQLKERDAKLRTRFESTRDSLLDWYAVGKKLKLIT